jgi:FdhE protein
MVGEGGKRYLICFRCESHWRYRRLGCPFCGEEDPELSGYFYSNQEYYRNLSASVCSSCSSYIKALRIEGDDPDDSHPEIEDLKTPGFDLAIEDEGYLRGAPNIYGIWIGAVGEEGDSAD